MDCEAVSDDEPEPQTPPPATREDFEAMIAKKLGGIQLGTWNDAVDWDHGAREMADFYTPLTGWNRLYLEWIYGRISSLFNAVMGAAAKSRRDTWQESAIEMLCGRTIGDLQTIGFLTGKGYFAQAYSSARMTYECCDLADLFWADRDAGRQWFESQAAHRDFSRRTVRGRLKVLGWEPADDNDIYGLLCERSHPRWAGLAHTVIEPAKNTLQPLSDVQSNAFRWDANYWTMAPVWRMGFRLRYIQAGMAPNDDVAAMLTNLNATFFVTLDFLWRKLEEITTPEQREEFEQTLERLKSFLHADGEMIARRVEQIGPA
jgi:hypothetical protein